MFGDNIPRPEGRGITARLGNRTGNANTIQVAALNPITHPTTFTTLVRTCDGPRDGHRGCANAEVETGASGAPALVVIHERRKYASVSARLWIQTSVRLWDHVETEFFHWARIGWIGRRGSLDLGDNGFVIDGIRRDRLKRVLDRLHMLMLGDLQAARARKR